MADGEKCMIDVFVKLLELDRIANNVVVFDWLKIRTRWLLSSKTAISPVSLLIPRLLFDKFSE